MKLTFTNKESALELLQDELYKAAKESSQDREDLYTYALIVRNRYYKMLQSNPVKGFLAKLSGRSLQDPLKALGEGEDANVQGLYVDTYVSLLRELPIADGMELCRLKEIYDQSYALVEEIQQSIEAVKKYNWASLEADFSYTLTKAL